VLLPAFAGLIEENICRLFLRGGPCFNHPNLALSMRIPVQKSRDTTWLPSFTAFTAPQKHQKLETPRKMPRDTNGTEVSVL